MKRKTDKYLAKIRVFIFCVCVFAVIVVDFCGVWIRFFCVISHSLSFCVVFLVNLQRLRSSGWFLFFVWTMWRSLSDGIWNISTHFIFTIITTNENMQYTTTNTWIAIFPNIFPFLLVSCESEKENDKKNNNTNKND